MMHRRAAAICGLLMILICAAPPARAVAEPTPEARPKFAHGTVMVKGKDGTPRNLRVEVARSEQEVAHGLMFESDLPGTDGMLFMMPKLELQRFWMKNTLIPLDIVFLDAEGRVVDVADHVQPLSTTHVVSMTPAQMVLEVKAGMAAQWGIEPGATVTPPPTLSE